MRSCNHCCSRKAISIAYFECVFLTLGIQHPMSMSHIIICGLLGCTLFFHIISQTIGFSKMLLTSIVWSMKFWLVFFFFVMKPARCTNFTNLFWHETLRVSDSSSVHHQEFYSLYTQQCYMSYSFVDSFRAWAYAPARKLSTNLYDVYHCWVYSE